MHIFISIIFSSLLLLHIIVLLLQCLKKKNLKSSKCRKLSFLLQYFRLYFLHFISSPFHIPAVKSLQSCPTLCDPMDCSLPGSSVHGICQARVLEWVAITFSWFLFYIWPKASYLPTVSLSFLIYKMGIIFSSQIATNVHS